MKQHKTVYSYWLIDTLDVMAQLGLNIKAITAGLPDLMSASPQSSSWIEVGIARQLWHEAFRVSQDSAIGFKVGSRLSIRAFNVLAPVISHSPNIMEAIQNAMRYQLLLSQSGSFDYQLRAGAIIAEYRPSASHTPIHYTQIDSVMAAFIKALRVFISDDITLNQVHLAGPPRADIAEYQAFYRCPVQLDAAAPRIELGADLFNITLNNSDPTLYRITKTLAEDRLARLSDVEQLHASVAEAIANQHYAHATTDQVANALALSSRTLQRKLGESGTSFRQIQMQVILKETTRLLQETASSVQEIGQLLGYTETSSFSRAIKKASGKSPAAIRQSLA